MQGKNWNVNRDNEAITGTVPVNFKDFFLYFILFIYFWLRWVFIAARGLSLVAEYGL